MRAGAARAQQAIAGRGSHSCHTLGLERIAAERSERIRELDDTLKAVVW
jgi:hypothetical protein